MDTGFESQDVQEDFSRARRSATLSRIARRLRGEPGDVQAILPFDEVVAALGRRGERRLALQPIELDSIVGTVDRDPRLFDRRFRPRSRLVRTRWERIARAERRGEAIPPIDVYRIGDLHFVKDGHHRVSVARAHGREVIDAYVTEVLTEVGPDREITLGDLPHKSHERIFFERVPLPADARSEIRFSDPARGFSQLGESVEAWGFRAIQATGSPMSRADVARTWLQEEFRPVVRMLREAGLVGKGTDADAYLRVAERRWFLLRTHDWDTGVMEQVRTAPDGT